MKLVSFSLSLFLNNFSDDLKDYQGIDNLLGNISPINSEESCLTFSIGDRLLKVKCPTDRLIEAPIHPESDLASILYYKMTSIIDFTHIPVPQIVQDNIPHVYKLINPEYTEYQDTIISNHDNFKYARFLRVPSIKSDIIYGVLEGALSALGPSELDRSWVRVIPSKILHFDISNTEDMNMFRNLLFQSNSPFNTHTDTYVFRTGTVLSRSNKEIASMYDSNVRIQVRNV